MSLSSTMKKQTTKKAIPLVTLVDTAAESPESIRQRIDAVNDQIEKLKLTIMQRQSMFQSEISNYEAAVKKKKIEAETQLSKLREQMDNELKELDQNNAKEIEEMEEKIKEAKENGNIFATRRRNLLLARKEAEKTELQQQLDSVRQANKSMLQENSVIIRQKNMNNVVKEAQYKEQIEILKMQITEVKSSIQQNLLLTTQRVRSTNQMYQERAEESQAKLEMMKKQLVDTENNNENAIRDYQKSGEATIAKYEKELENSKKRGQTLLELRDKLTAKHKSQARSLQKEIENAKEAIKQAQERIEEQKDDIVKQEQKLNAIQQDNLTIEDQIEDVRDEIETTKSENGALKKELDRLRTNHYKRRFDTITKKDVF